MPLQSLDLLYQHQETCSLIHCKREYMATLKTPRNFSRPEMKDRLHIRKYINPIEPPNPNSTPVQRNLRPAPTTSMQRARIVYKYNPVEWNKCSVLAKPKQKLIGRCSYFAIVIFRWNTCFRQTIQMHERSKEATAEHRIQPPSKRKRKSSKPVEIETTYCLSRFL